MYVPIDVVGIVFNNAEGGRLHDLQDPKGGSQH